MAKSVKYCFQHLLNSINDCNNSSWDEWSLVTLWWRHWKCKRECTPDQSCGCGVDIQNYGTVLSMNVRCGEFPVVSGYNISEAELQYLDLLLSRWWLFYCSYLKWIAERSIKSMYSKKVFVLKKDIIVVWCTQNA